MVGVFVDGVACDRSMDKRVCGQLSEVFRNHPGRFQFESPPVFGDQHSLRLDAPSMFWLMNAEMVIETRDNEPELLNARTWRARKGSMQVMKGRTWHYHGIDHKAKRTRTYVLQIRLDCISGKNGRRDNIPPNALAVPKTVFSYAMIVMDKVEGWNEEEWVGSKFAACMWIYTKAVLCDGHRRPPQDLRQMFDIIMECLSCLCEAALWKHEWVTEPNVLRKENDILEALNYDLDVPCPLQW